MTTSASAVPSARSAPDIAIGRLATAVVSMSWDQLPPELQAHALDLLVDAVAVISGGSVEPSIVALRSQVAPVAGPATVIGAGIGTPTRDAVLLNAATITVLQRQDGYSDAIGHPASQLLATLLPLAEQTGASARDLLEAFVGGYEAAARIGVALGGVPPHLHDVQGAAAGLTAVPGTVERFYGRYSAVGFDAAALAEGVDMHGRSHHRIGGGYVKLHPSCAHLHGVNDAVDQLIAEEGLREADVDRVELAVFDAAMRIESRDPHNTLAARLSARATVAAALRRGRLDDAGLADPAALAPLMRRIEVCHDPDLDSHAPAGRPGRVTVTRTDGTVVSRTVIHPRGTQQVPATEAERAHKARNLLARPYGDDRAAEIVAAVRALPAAQSLHDLTASLRSRPADGGS
ncbi:MAG: hypothetical protein ABS81_06495 [Pseudonocardia sp. SCN 72-86]|nr:MAG: hypothetical protein ABS81_06495 [Pseudonocardia sp. SCN 72-86]